MTLPVRGDERQPHAGDLGQCSQHAGDHSGPEGRPGSMAANCRASMASVSSWTRTRRPSSGRRRKKARERAGPGRQRRHRPGGPWSGISTWRILAPEFVTTPPHRQDQARIGRILLDLLPEPSDMHVDGPRIAVEVPAPDQVEQLLPREDLAAMLDQDAEQGRIPWRKARRRFRPRLTSCPSRSIRKFEDSGFAVAALAIRSGAGPSGSWPSVPAD